MIFEPRVDFDPNALKLDEIVRPPATSAAPKNMTVGSSSVARPDSIQLVLSRHVRILNRYSAFWAVRMILEWISSQVN